MRYGLAEITLTAIEDFLRGPDVLADGGAETVSVVRKLWSEHPETTNHPAWAVPGIPDVAMPRTAAAGWPSMMRSVLAKRILRAVERDSRHLHYRPLVKGMGILNGLSPAAADRVLRRMRGETAAPRRD